MADFSDREDRELVQLVMAMEERGKRISWVAVARKMAYAKKTNEQLRGRLKTLKSTHGKQLSLFPPHFFRPPRAPQQHAPQCSEASRVASHQQLQSLYVSSQQQLSVDGGGSQQAQTQLGQTRVTVVEPYPTQESALWAGGVSPRLCHAQQDHEMSAFHIAETETVLEEEGREETPTAQPGPRTCHLLRDFNAMLDSFTTPTKQHHPALSSDSKHSTSKTTQALGVFYISTHDGIERPHPLQPLEASTVTSNIFKSIPRSVVRQRSGHAETNVGELSGPGVSELVRLSNLTGGDTFMDIGSGIGNVIVQVALQTEVKTVVGIEMRAEVAEAGRSEILKAQSEFAHLMKVRVVVADIRTCRLGEDETTRKTTVLFAHNTVFKADSNLALCRACCELPSLRLVVLGTLVCPRHRASCGERFCEMWEPVGPVGLGVTYNSELVSMYMYERRHSSSHKHRLVSTT